MSNKRDIKQRYVDQRRELREQHVEEFGSSRGWTKTEDYKRIERNERQSFYRHNKRIEAIKATEYDEEIQRIESGEEYESQIFQDTDPIATGEFFWEAFNRRGGDAGTIIDEIEDSISAGENPKLMIKNFDGEVKTHTDLLQMELAVQRLYNKSNEIYEEARKAGKGGSDQSPTIDVTKVLDQNGDTFFIVNTKLNQ